MVDFKPRRAVSTKDVAIPEELLDVLKRSRLGKLPIDEQVRAALAIQLYQEGVISIGRAAELAKESRVGMELLLIEMGIPVVRLDLAEYEREIATLERIQDKQ
jgi:predicted HTH domain antitoxin